MTHYLSDRRAVLRGLGGVVAAAFLPPVPAAAESPARFTLRAESGDAGLVSDPAVRTPVWGYNGHAPGPVLRARQGQGMRVAVANALDEPTTVHWHGLRGANAMDGVPYLTQEPIQPGETFVYDLETPDAGVFWYHPHMASSRQVGRGLHGAIVVDPPETMPVDDDLLWVLDDWRLDQAGAIHAASFGGFHDGSHAGRLGNVVTINGTPQEVFETAPGMRLRVRLVNVANARVFGLAFGDLNPWVTALDGHPVVPARLGNEELTIGPGMRADVVFDVPSVDAAEYPVTDRHYSRQTYRLAAFQASGAARERKSVPPRAETANPLPEPALDDAQAFELRFSGGAMRGFESGILDGEALGFRAIAERGYFWTVNGVVRPAMAPGMNMEPLADIPLGRTARVRIVNETAWEHPVHLHGFVFHVLAVNGKAPKFPNAFLDTVLVGPDDEVEIAFVCDRPGDWAFHCHILEHQESGMMGFIRVG